MAVVLVPLVVAGCTTITPIHAKDGEKALLAECSGALSKCHQVATESCPSGYFSLLEQPAGLDRYAVTFRCKT